MPQTGTYDISQLLEIQFQTVADFGVNTVVQTLQRDLDMHNSIVVEALRDIAVPTTAQLDAYGTGSTGDMEEVDEYGRSETQVARPGSSVGYPLRLFQYNIGWTKRFLKKATPADIAKAQIAAQIAHRKRLRIDLKKAIYGSTNYTYNDHLVNKVDIPVKRLVNADSAGIPDAPDGSSFNTATHTHYDASATLTTAVVDAGITDLIEHGHGDRVMIAIHYSNAAAFAALTGFIAAVPSYVQTPAYNVTTPTGRTNLGNQYNRLVGYYGAAEVWVKPWAIANYMFIWDAGSSEKPLKIRLDAGADSGLQIAATFDSHPLQADYYEALFGFGVWTRTNGVVVQFNNGTYQNPTITS